MREDGTSLESTPTPTLSNLLLASREATPTPSGSDMTRAESKRKRQGSDAAHIDENAAKRGKHKTTLTEEGTRIYKDLRNISTRIIRFEAQADFIKNCLDRSKIPQGYHLVVLPPQNMTQNHAFVEKWKELLADSSNRLMNLTLEGYNSTIQSLEQKKLELMTQVSSLPTNEQQETTTALNAVCTRVGKQSGERFQKRRDGYLKSLSRESFLEYGHNQRAKKKQMPRDRRPRDRRQKATERYPSRGPSRRPLERNPTRGPSTSRPTERNPSREPAGSNKTEVLTEVLKLLLQ